MPVMLPNSTTAEVAWKEGYIQKKYASVFYFLFVALFKFQNTLLECAILENLEKKAPPDMQDSKPVYSFAHKNQWILSK